MKRLLVLVAALALSSCSLEVANPTVPNANPSDPSKETFDPSMRIDISKMTKTAAGAYYRDTTVGSGATFTGNGIAVLSYLGLLKNGAPFEQIIEQTVVVGNLVGGLQEAIPGMRVGGERIIVVPSALGFGAVAVNGVPAQLDARL